MVETTTSMLRATGLCKSYGKGEAATHALAGTNIELAAGRLVAVMGASGSGKTTLLHLLAGLLRPDSGTIEFAGRELASLSDRQLTALRCAEIGVVFQSFNLLPTLRVVDNVAIPLLLAGNRRAPARAAASKHLDRLGIEHLRNRLPAQLSGGEQQRVAIARALVHDPKLLLADEPTGNLDRTNVEAVCTLLQDVAAASNRAVVLVTHDPLVASFANEIVVLVDGRVADRFDRHEVTSVEDLTLRYLAASTARASEVVGEVR